VHYNVWRGHVFRDTPLFCVRFYALDRHGIQLARLLRTILSERWAAFREKDARVLCHGRATMRTIEGMKAASPSRATCARRENA